METTIEQWIKLFSLADEIKAIAPWTFMYEDEIITYTHPETNKRYYISVMGSGGENFSVTSYMGDDSLSHFIKALNTPYEFERMEQILTSDLLILSFEKRDILDKSDKEIIKQLGLKYRGAFNYPVFSIRKPGI